MSFMSFTLYPHGGAFMMCESLSEFDANALDADAGANVMSPQEQEKVIDGCCSGDLVTATLNKLANVYDTIVHPIMSMPLDTYNGKEFVEKAEQIGNYATDLAERLRKLCAEMKTTEQLISPRHASVANFMYESIKANLAFFIKNLPQLERLGYGKTTYSTAVHPAFSPYDTNRFVVSVVSNFDAFRNNIIDLDVYESFAGDRTIKMLFESIPDMFNVMFHDPERRVRQERQYNDDINISSIVRYDLCEGRPTVEGAGCEDQYCKILNCVSTALRGIKQKVYNIQVDMLDRVDTTSNEVNRQLYEMCATLTNIFIVTSASLIASAYELHGYIARKTAIDSYAKEALSAIKQ